MMDIDFITFIISLSFFVISNYISLKIIGLFYGRSFIIISHRFILTLFRTKILKRKTCFTILIVCDLVLSENISILIFLFQWNK